MYWRNRTWLVRRLCEPIPAASRPEPFAGLPRRDAETLSNWTEAARERGAVLFVGAGWTLNAEPEARRYREQSQDKPASLLWTALSERFRDALRADVSDGAPADPLWLAELYRQRYGNDALSRLLGEAVPDDRLRPGPLHEALRSVPWRAILTTNYDTLLERTFQPHRRICVCVDDVDLVRSAAGSSLELVHLHGVLQRPDTIVLAYEDYRRYPQRHPAFITKARQLFLQHPVLFLGFGLTDPNFLQWAGWLADIVGEHKNPWVNLTLDPTPGLSHARYWGTRLDFVSIPELSRFRAVVPAVLSVLGEALGKDGFSRDVARWRIAEAANASELVVEVERLLRTGEERGKDGPDWARFRIWLFDAAASHVLDLAGEAWREPSQEEREAKSELRIEIDMRPPSMRGQDEELVAVLRRAFGSRWNQWRELLLPHCGGTWLFHRVDLRDTRPSNVWNETAVPLQDSDSATPPAPVDSGTGDAALDALRAGELPTVPAVPRTAQEHRMAGYMWYQRGDMVRAAASYRLAVAKTRQEHEPLRTEWLTLVSQRHCLDQVVLDAVGDDHPELKLEHEGVIRDLARMVDELAERPREEGGEPLRDYQLSSLFSVGDQLVKDLDRYDIDRTMRHGQIYGESEEWLDALERLWVTPSLSAKAAESLGVLQWRYDAPVEAIRTLSRYGSKRLEKVVASVVHRRDKTDGQEGKLLAELLSDGRWPGEWLARVEALVHLVPYCTATEMETLGGFVLKAREELSTSDEIYRGSSMTAGWTAPIAVEKLEAARWTWLSPAAVLDCIERWCDHIASADERALNNSGAFRTLDQLPWTRWAQDGLLDGARTERLFVRLLDGRLAIKRRKMFADLETLVDRVAMLSDDRVLSTSRGTPLGDRVERAVALLPHASQRVFAAVLTRVNSDSADLDAVVTDALASIDATKRDSLETALRVVGAAATCPSTSLPLLTSALGQLVDAAVVQLTKNPGHAMRDWGTIDALRLVAFVVARVGSHATEGLLPELRDITSAVVDALPATVEYFAAVPPDRMNGVTHKIDGAMLMMLRSGDGAGRFSSIEQQYIGLRGVVRAVVQLGPSAVSAEWIVNVTAMTRAHEPSLAAYSTWILSEWMARLAAESANTSTVPIVAAALRGAAFDGRIRVRANALRGLVAFQRIAPDPMNTEIIARSAEDPRIAIRRALEGNGDAEAAQED